jgi:hypothetical protein
VHNDSRVLVSGDAVGFLTGFSPELFFLLPRRSLRGGFGEIDLLAYHILIPRPSSLTEVLPLLSRLAWVESSLETDLVRRPKVRGTALPATVGIEGRLSLAQTRRARV